MISKETLLELNKNYYRAFENFDLESMSQIWENADDVVCIHPGWDLLLGWDQVKESWQKIFSEQTLLKFTIRNPKVMIFENIGIISCTEEIFISSTSAISQNFFATTNMFRKTESGLKMFYHHSSAILVNERNIQITYH